MSSSPTAWITGASAGIGQAVATQLSQQGYHTLLIARRRDRLEALASSLENATAVTLDLADAQAVRQTATELLEKHGGPQVLINNAGYGDYRPMLELTEAEHRQLFEVNYHAPAALMHAVLPGMVQQGQGHVINIASIAARFGPWGHGPYGGAKAALVALTQSLAIEHQDDKVHLSYVLPGVVKTEFFDQRGYEKMHDQVAKHGIGVDQVARKIVRLIKHPKLALYVPGHYRFIDWIGAISPALLKRIVASSSKPPPEPPEVSPGKS